jgi:hypothetical protein
LSNPQIISTVIGLLIGSIIFFLVRRDHLVSKDGIRWLIVAVFIVLYGAFPSINDELGSYLGIGYPPIIPVLLGIGAVLIKLLINDTQRVAIVVDMERMIQRIAILEAELEHEKLIRNSDNIKPLKVNSAQFTPIVTRSATVKSQSTGSQRIEPVISELLHNHLDSSESNKVEHLKSVANKS